MGGGWSGEVITGGVPGALPELCAPGLPFSEWGDSRCSAGLNNVGCGWDGGDCCFSTCVGPFCNSDEDCQDPNASENGGFSIFVDKKTITVKGANPNSAVVIYTSSIYGEGSIPSGNLCGGTEMGIVQEETPRFIALTTDSDGHLSFDIPLDIIPENFRDGLDSVCSQVFQAVTDVDDSCTTSNVAFIQNLVIDLWNNDSCVDHGNDWCIFDGSPVTGIDDYYYGFSGGCCMSSVFWCDGPYGCIEGEAGTPSFDYHTGPDKCRIKWLAPDLWYDYN